MAVAVAPLRALARLALDTTGHRRVHASREGDQVLVEERADDGTVVRRWSGTPTDWDRALHRAAGLKTPSSPGFTVEPKSSSFGPVP